MNKQQGINKDLIELLIKKIDEVKKETEKIDEVKKETEKIDDINKHNTDISKRLESIEDKISGMNDKVNDNRNNIKWIIGVGSTTILSIIGFIVSQFIKNNQ